MTIRKLTLGELQTNCYLVYDEKTKEGIIIDPADDANFISEQTLSLNVNPKFIVATHGHYDHILAAWELQLAFNIPFFIHKDDLFLVKNLNKSASHWSSRKIVERPPEKIDFLQEGESIVFVKIIHTPGHTPGSVCLYNKEEKILFTGDTLFADGIGRTDFSYSSAKDIKESVNKILSLPEETIIYPGHGENASI